MRPSYAAIVSFGDDYSQWLSLLGHLSLAAPPGILA
jgi:hypothetical protein